jgi:hypothetical protein
MMERVSIPLIVTSSIDCLDLCMIFSKYLSDHAQASERITTGVQRGQGSRKSHHSAALPQMRRRVAPDETGFRNSSQTASLSHRSLLRGTVSSDGERLARRVPA